MNNMATTLLGCIALAIILALGYLVLGYSPDLEKERLEILKRKGFRAFRAKYPDAFRAGQVTCPFCSGRGVFIRTERRPFLRQHSCRTCGRGLYFS